MKQLNSTEIQKIGNNILLYIKEVCKNHSIPFYLAYGTVIGAVRHKGFIPWDDDIDIYMLRQDYEKFKEIVLKTPSRYKLLDIELDSNYYMPQVKLMDTMTLMDSHVVKRKYPLGVWVDIYVLDNVTDNDSEMKRFHHKLNFLQKCYSRSIYQHRIVGVKSFLGILFSFVVKLIGPRYFSKRMVKLSKQYNNKNTRRIAPSSFTASSREEAVLEREIIGKGIEMEFEGEKYLVPEQTDKYLRHFYGDYMKLPPVEKRVSNHTADFYLKGE